MKLTLLALIALLAAPYLVQPASAQTTQTTTAPRKAIKPVHPSVIGRTDLNGPPTDLPVPPPQGSRFIMGYQTQYSSSKPMEYVRLEIERPLAEIANWYASALRQQTGWNLSDRTSQNGKTLLANRSGATLRIDLSSVKEETKQATAIGITFNR